MVGNDEDFLRIASTQLAEQGYEIIYVPNGEMAMKVLRRERIDLILLDSLLSDGGGCDFCKRMRGAEGGFSGPVIFVNCPTDGPDIVEAFRSGGDDYLVKPVRLPVLTERIKANLERIGNVEQERKRQWFKQFMIDKSRREVYRVNNGQLGEKIPLSPLEYGILEAMIRHCSEVVLYRELYRDVWQQDDLGDVRPLMVHVSNLRKKVDQNHTEMIMAVRGVGYLFQDE